MKKYYYSIGEVSNLLNVKPHVIRYWETEFSQLKPRHQKGKNRRYSEETVKLLQKIKYLLYDQKYTIKGVKSKLDSMDKKELENQRIIDREKLKNEIINDLIEIKNYLLSD